MKHLAVAGLALGLLMLCGTTSCDPPPDERDPRLAEFARQSVEQQARQNEALSRQSEAVVAQSGKLAEAARQLVDEDARARREMVAAHQQLQDQLGQQRAAVDAQRDRLEQERQQIARQRHRDPLIAAAVQSFGGILACLLPLLVCLYLLHRLTASDGPDHALGELLIEELTADRPTWLPLPPGSGTAALSLEETGRPRLDNDPRRESEDPIPEPPF